VSAELVEGSFEIVEDDAIGEALEDKCEFPERVDDANWNHRCHRQKVDNGPGNAKTHTHEQDAETGRRPDDFGQAKFVLEAYVPKEIANCEYPPWIACHDVSADRDFLARWEGFKYRKTASYGLVSMNRWLSMPLK
jgi:hypothetical protein